MGQILEIQCEDCSANQKVFVGGGWEFSITKLYHCPTCYWIKDKTFQDENNPLNTNYKKNNAPKIEDLLRVPVECEKCKTNKINSIMNEIQESDLEILNCHQCKQKELKVFVAGYWD